MYSRLKGQNLYRTKLAADLTPITQGAGDDPTTEFSFYVEVAPAVSKGYVYIDFTKDAKRDLIYFHKVIGTTLYYYRGNRDLESNGVYGITHTKGSFLQLNDVDKWIDRTFDTVDDLGYIDVISNKKIKIFGGTTYFKGIQKTIADTAFQTLADGTRYAVLDYSDETVKFVAAVDYDNHLWFATVIVASGIITSVTNQKGEQLHSNKTTLDNFLKDGTWVRYNTFLVGDVLGPGSSTDNNIVTMDGATGKKIKDSGKSISTDGTFASNSDGKVPTEKAVKTYADTKIPKSDIDTNVNLGSSDTKVPSQKAVKTYVDANIGTIGVQKGGVAVGSKKNLNFIEGYGISMSISQNTPNDRIDVRINSTGGTGGSNVIRVSQPNNNTIGDVLTFTHNLGLTQADVESGRYQIKFTYKVTSTPVAGIDSAGTGALSGAPMVQQYIWDATDPIAPFNIHMQADSLKVLSSSWSDNLENVRCIIIDNNVVGGGILPPWTTTYDTTFLVIDSLGNAIVDAIITLDGVTNDAGDYTFDTLLGNFSYSCDRPGYTTASGDVLIDGVSTHTIVLTATGAGIYNLTFDISSDILGPLTDAIVTLNGVVYPVGQTVFSMPDDTYNYTVNRLGHNPVSGSVVISGADVTEVILLTALPPLYHATFTVEDALGNPITDAWIEFEGNTYPASYYDFITNADTYVYTVHRRGYASVSGVINLTEDTIIDIVMTQTSELHELEFVVHTA